MTSNPYLAPEAEIAPPVRKLATGQLQYAGFWRRFGAFWLDGLVLLPLLGLSYWLGTHSRMSYIYCLLAAAGVRWCYNVHLVKRWGGTPGQLLLGLRILRVDGSRIGLVEAVLRYLVLFLLSAISATALAMAVLRMTEPEYVSLDFVARNARLVELTPGWYRGLAIASSLWVWSEFLVMFTNQRRRGPQDFIAGTVVVRGA